jgi:2-haloacid dehalogenase
MNLTIAIDVYGTLIDTNGMVVALQAHLGDRALEFSKVWREKQLEYSFRRGLMQQYQPFSICTEQAFDFTCSQFSLEISPAQRQRLIDHYQFLPAFPEVGAALAQAVNAKFRLFAFSNGTRDAVSKLLEHAAISRYFLDCVSVDDVANFKPAPVVYQHLLTKTSSKSEQTWLISSNPFDIIGAQALRLKTLWIQRSPSQLFDPWGITPDAHATDLTQAISLLSHQFK